jgi:hypothetical protein
MSFSVFDSLYNEVQFPLFAMMESDAFKVSKVYVMQRRGYHLPSRDPRAVCVASSSGVRSQEWWVLGAPVPDVAVQARHVRTPGVNTDDKAEGNEADDNPTIDGDDDLYI